MSCNSRLKRNSNSLSKDNQIFKNFSSDFSELNIICFPKVCMNTTYNIDDHDPWHLSVFEKKVNQHKRENLQVLTSVLFTININTLSYYLLSLFYHKGQKQKMSNNTYAPWHLLLKRVFERRVIYMYREPVKKWFIL